jgi:hypothetical protein
VRRHTIGQRRLDDLRCRSHGQLVALLLDRDRDEQRHTTVKTTSAALHDLIVAMSPQRVVFEICPIAGWLPLEQVEVKELWRGQLHVELQALEQIGQLIEQVEAKLQTLAEPGLHIRP